MPPGSQPRAVRSCQRQLCQPLPQQGRQRRLCRTSQQQQTARPGQRTVRAAGRRSAAAGTGRTRLIIGVRPVHVRRPEKQDTVQSLQQLQPATDGDRRQSPRIHEQSKCAERTDRRSELGTYLAVHVAARRCPYSAH